MLRGSQSVCGSLSFDTSKFVIYILLPLNLWSWVCWLYYQLCDEMLPSYFKYTAWTSFSPVSGSLPFLLSLSLSLSLPFNLHRPFWLNSHKHKRIIVWNQLNPWDHTCVDKHHTHAHTHSLTHTRSHTHTHANTTSHRDTGMHTYTHAHTHTHTQTYMNQMTHVLFVPISQIDGAYS